MLRSFAMSATRRVQVDRANPWSSNEVVRMMKVLIARRVLLFEGLTLVLIYVRGLPLYLFLHEGIPKFNAISRRLCADTVEEARNHDHVMIVRILDVFSRIVERQAVPCAHLVPCSEFGSDTVIFSLRSTLTPMI